MTAKPRTAASILLAFALAGILATASALAEPAGSGRQGLERGPAAEVRSRQGGDPAGWRLMPRGIGPLRLGMSAARARALVPRLSVAHHRFCDTWSVPGLDGVYLSASHSRGGLSVASISSYSEDLASGHGAGGVELGETLGALKARFGKRLKFAKRLGSLGKSFYRLYGRPGGRRTALEFTIAGGRIEFQQVGFVGEFYYTDGVELCA